MKKLQKSPAAPPAPEIPGSSTQSIIEVLRREYAEADDRRREREREFCYGPPDKPQPLTRLPVFNIFRSKKGSGAQLKMRLEKFDADRSMRGLEQGIAEFRTWREALLMNPHFLRALDAMPKIDRLEGGMKIVACLLNIQDIFEGMTPMSKAVNPRDVADELRESEQRAAMLEDEARQQSSDDALLLRRMAAHLRPLGSATMKPELLAERLRPGLSDESAWRGWCVKELEQHIPEGIKNRDALIVGLLKHAGLNVKNPNVNSILGALREKRRK